jgi:hypothetical protein
MIAMGVPSDLPFCDTIGLLPSAHHISFIFEINLEGQMSATKRMLEEANQAEIEAQNILIDSGYLERCEYHEEVFNGRGENDFTEAYKLANARISSGEFEPPTGYSRRDYTDLIQEVAESAPEECHLCSRWRDD